MKPQPPGASMKVDPVVLEGRWVRLEPLEERHASDLAQAWEPDTFRYFATARLAGPTEADARAFIHTMLALPRMVPFALVDRSSKQAIGGTAYLDIQPEHRSLEIGMTWIHSAHRGTTVNPEMKRLLLEHAFEVLGCTRVQLKTDERNMHSRNAMLKLGAKFEGILRNHLVLPDGHLRNTAMFSILPDEWPAVRTGLDLRLLS